MHVRRRRSPTSISQVSAPAAPPTAATTGGDALRLRLRSRRTSWPSSPTDDSAPCWPPARLAAVGRRARPGARRGRQRAWARCWAVRLTRLRGACSPTRQPRCLEPHAIIAVWCGLFDSLLGWGRPAPRRPDRPRPSQGFDSGSSGPAPSDGSAALPSCTRSPCGGGSSRWRSPTARRLDLVGVWWALHKLPGHGLAAAVITTSRRPRRCCHGDLDKVRLGLCPGPAGGVARAQPAYPPGRAAPQGRRRSPGGCRGPRGRLRWTSRSDGRHVTVHLVEAANRS